MAEFEIYQLLRNDPATLTSTLFGLPSTAVHHIFIDNYFMKLITFFSIVTAEYYQVLGTDYTNYAVEWRCEDRGIFQHRGT